MYNAEKARKKVFELLLEFDTICKKNDIQYFISKETLLHSFCEGTLSEDAFCAYIMMQTGEAKKLLEVLEKSCPNNRKFECWLNSRNYPDFTIKYVDEESVCFNFLEKLNYRFNGIFISIDILTGRDMSSKFSRKMYKMIERGTAFESFNENNSIFLKSLKKNAICYIGTKISELFLGKKLLRRKLFNHLCNNKAGISNGKGISKDYELRINRVKKIKVSENYLKGSSCVKIDGHDFPAPDYTEAFLRLLYPQGFSRISEEDSDGRLEDKNPQIYKVLKATSSLDNMVVNAEIPYADFFSDKKYGRKFFKQAYTSKFKKDVAAYKAKKYSKRAINNWKVATQTDNRFQFHELYSPQKTHIIDLYKAGNLEELDKLFEPYYDSLAETNFNFPFAFDEEIMNIFVETLIAQGKNTQANKFLKLMPKSHLNPVELRRYDNEY